MPFLDRFHISVTGFPFPLGPFFQRRTIRKEVNVNFDRIASHWVLPTCHDTPFRKAALLRIAALTIFYSGMSTYAMLQHLRKLSTDVLFICVT